MKDSDMDIQAVMAEIGAKAKAAAGTLAYASAERKHAALIGAADAVWANRAEIIAANDKDMIFGADKGLSPAMMDRLKLDEERIRAVVDGLRAVAEQPDPVGELLEEWDMASGLHIARVRTPLGVIGVIFESRPNVTADAGALCLKAGNAAILRPGSEAFNSAQVIHACMIQGLAQANLPTDAIQIIPTRDRAAVGEMLTMTDTVDVIVPRGGKGLVGLVQSEARVPVFAHLEGIVHIYVDRDADVDKTRKVIVNAKTRRTGICGAVECLLIDRAFLDAHGAPFLEDLIAAGVEVRGDSPLHSINGVIESTPQDWGHEYLDMIVAAKTVDGLDGAMAHIRQYGSNHTDAIMTENAATAARFLNELDSAILMHNASTQFADGGEFGMGAEIGIATGKLHARGPVGAKQLTSFKYQVTGDGTIRG